MASAFVQDSSQHEEPGNKSIADIQEEEEEEEEEEELFEIDLEAVNSIPPPHYWESCFTATSSALLANCLLPISDVSCAVPTTSTACEALSLAEQLTLLRLQSPHQHLFQELVGYSSKEM